MNWQNFLDLLMFVSIFGLGFSLGNIHQLEKHLKFLKELQALNHDFLKSVNREVK